MWWFMASNLIPFRRFDEGLADEDEDEEDEEDEDEVDEEPDESAIRLAGLAARVEGEAAAGGGGRNRDGLKRDRAAAAAYCC